MGEQSLYKLVSRHEVIEAGQGDGVLNARVMGIEGNDVGNTHGDQLLQCHCTV